MSGCAPPLTKSCKARLEKGSANRLNSSSDDSKRCIRGLGRCGSWRATLADLHVLTNVKTRGGWGEWQLGALLAEMLTPDQFARNVKTRDDDRELVEFAIKLPGDENGRQFGCHRREIPDGRLRAFGRGAGKRRSRGRGRAMKSFGNTVEEVRQRHLR